MRLLLLLLALGLVSCQPKFHLAYKESVEAFEKGTSPEGPWKGRWKSDVNGHHGPLWCIVTQDPKQPDQWIFRYRAGWGILEFGDYKHPVEAVLQADQSLPIESEMELPNNYGTYGVKGELTADQFKLRFKGSGDEGIMILTRPN